jgi:hypothetical protein
MSTLEAAELQRPSGHGPLPRPGKSFYGPDMASLSIRIGVSLIALLAVSACNANRSRFPSLAIRPAERTYGTRPQTTPAPPPKVAASADLPACVAALREKATASHARFTAQQVSATKLVDAAKGAAPGTEGWSRAAIALAALSTARGEGMNALSDLDRLLIAATEAAATGPDNDLKVVAPAHRDVAALLGEEDQTIATLSDKLGG